MKLDHDLLDTIQETINRIKEIQEQIQEAVDTAKELENIPKNLEMAVILTQMWEPIYLKTKQEIMSFKKERERNLPMSLSTC